MLVLVLGLVQVLVLVLGTMVQARVACSHPSQMLAAASKCTQPWASGAALVKQRQGVVATR